MSGRPNLSGAFAPSVAPARGAVLQGLLAPKRRGSAAQAPAPAKEPESPERSAEALAEKTVQVPPASELESNIEQGPTVEQTSTKERERSTVEPELVSATTQTQKPAPQQQPAAKRGAASAVKASETVPGGLRNVGVYLPPALLADVKDAVYHARTTYADLLIDAFEALDEEQISGEFTVETMLTRSGMPRRAPRKRGEAGIQIQLRLDGLQVAWLDEKVVEFGAPSRSALVSAVFKLHVPARLTAKE